MVIVVQSIGRLVSQSSRMQNFARVTNFRNAIANIFSFEFNKRIKKLAIAAPCTEPGSQAISNFKIPTRQIAFQSNNVSVPMLQIQKLLRVTPFCKALANIFNFEFGRPVKKFTIAAPCIQVGTRTALGIRGLELRV